ncbi:unnamed protein product [Effrenium voratum]|uniref:DUF7495 domain-containing protein n=1 Tax=Effrenium voratum TaxID=2562239 RepID=A0AA36NIC4_9DINO|nr:unnamed protein product [Effrenium voratum]CAJ1435988.1 unnamed protein product [Effrenium voratum]
MCRHPMLFLCLLYLTFEPLAGVDVAVGSGGEIHKLVRVESRPAREGSTEEEDPEGFSGVEENPLTRDTWPDGTWNKADEYCRAKGKQLCDYKKVCPSGRSRQPAIPGGQKKYEMWTPVRNLDDPDNPVEWAQVGTRHVGDLCCLISSDCHGKVKNFQGWGQVKPFNGFVYCCENDLPANLEEFKLSNRHWNGSWTEAASLCEKKGLRLAEWGEICPRGRGKSAVVPQLGKLMWTPVLNSGDKNNSVQWAQVGLRMEGDICKLITDFPGHEVNFRGWGELRPYTEYIYCRSNKTVQAEDPKSGANRGGAWPLAAALLLGFVWP